nr:iron ABC transporter permease [uncultured Marinobacter sp.]
MRPVPRVWRSPDDRWSIRCQPRVLGVVALLSLLLVLSAGVSLSMGSHPMTLSTMLQALIAPGDDPGIQLILFEIRLPRIVMGILVGAALGVSGLMLQGLVRNPLASPDVIGITSGASAAAVLSLWLGGTAVALVPAAMLGALTVASVIVALAWHRGVSPGRLVLVGIGLAAGLTSLTTLLLVLSPDTTAMMAYVWLTGSLYASRWQDVLGLAPWLALCLPLALAKARHLDIQAMGNDLAQGLGSAVQGHRLLFLLLSVALAGSAVAYAGALGFVGLMAPHLARRLVRAGHPGLLIITGLTGALIVLWADLIGRTGFVPRDLPAGIFVAGIGAPFFVFLLYRLRRQGR